MLAPHLEVPSKLSLFLELGMFSVMNCRSLPVWCIVLIALSAFMLMMVTPLRENGVAMAACTDFAAPEVQWLRCYLDERHLANVDLARANVRESSFQRSDLSGTDFSHANAYRSKMISARLMGAKLDGASFTEADFTRADLTGASLRDTDLRRARFYRAILRTTDLSGARLEGADLLDADLSGATWIDGLRVCGTDSIGQCN